MAVQTSYAERMNPAVAGMPANMRNFDAITRTADGGIAFGVAVSRDADDPENKCAQGGALADFLGITYKDITLEVSQSDAFVDGNNVGIMTSGEVWVSVTGVPGPNDPVHYDATTGVFKSSGGNGPILGARWMGETENGLCRLKLPDYGQAAA